MDSKLKGIINNEISDKNFIDCEMSEATNEGRLISINEKFNAISLKAKGDILIVDFNKNSTNKNQCCINLNNKILDLEFSPFNNNILCSCSSSENSSVIFTELPDNLDKTLIKQETIFEEKIDCINFNPVVQDIICLGTSQQIYVWNITKKETFSEFQFKAKPIEMEWSPNGSLIGVTTKLKKMHIYDPRFDKMIFNQEINKSFLQSHFVWIDDNSLAFTCIDKNKEEFLKLFDLRKMASPDSVKIENSRRETFTFINREMKIIYTIAKNENRSIMEANEYCDGIFKKIDSFQLTSPLIYSALFNRNCLDKNRLEIDRFACYFKNSKKINFIRKFR